MFSSVNLTNEMARLKEQVRQIKKDRPNVIALQGAPRLNQEEIRQHILDHLDNEYNVFRGDILHSTDNILLIKRGLGKAYLIKDLEAVEWMLKSNVSMCGVILEPKESESYLGPKAIFSIFVGSKATESDILANAYYILKKLKAEKLSTSNLVLLCHSLKPHDIEIFERVLDIEIDTGLRRRATRRTPSGN